MNKTTKERGKSMPNSDVQRSYPGPHWSNPVIPTWQCDHIDFESNVRVIRLEDPDLMEFRLELSVRCKDCGMNFAFMGMPTGYMRGRPTVSVDRREIRCPIIPD